MTPEQALQLLDAGLTRSIDRLLDVRAELSTLVGRAASSDLPDEGDRAAAEDIIGRAVLDLDNPAQLEVLRRAHLIARSRPTGPR